MKESKTGWWEVGVIVGERLGFLEMVQYGFVRGYCYIDAAAASG